MSTHGTLVCATCHPPAAPDLVRQWWVRRPSGQWLALQPTRPAQHLRVTSPPGTVRGAIQAFLASQGAAP
jgi:hypothetical protein